VTTISRGAVDPEPAVAAALKPGMYFTGFLDTTLMVIFITGVVLVLVDSVRRWIMVLNGAPVPVEAFGPPVTKEGEVKMGCC